MNDWIGGVYSCDVTHSGVTHPHSNTYANEHTLALAFPHEYSLCAGGYHLEAIGHNSSHIDSSHVIQAKWGFHNHMKYLETRDQLGKDVLT